jgi:hypothetical protein
MLVSATLAGIRGPSAEQLRATTDRNALCQRKERRAIATRQDCSVSILPSNPP